MTACWQIRQSRQDENQDSLSGREEFYLKILWDRLGRLTDEGKDLLLGRRIGGAGRRRELFLGEEKHRPPAVG